MEFSEFQGKWRHLAQIADWDEREQIMTLLALIHALDSEGTHSPAGEASERVQAFFRDNPGEHVKLCRDLLEAAEECWRLEMQQKGGD